MIIFFALRCRCFYYSIMSEFYSPQRDERLPMSPKNAFHWHPISSVLLKEMNVINRFWASDKRWLSKHSDTFQWSLFKYIQRPNYSYKDMPIYCNPPYCFTLKSSQYTASIFYLVCLKCFLNSFTYAQSDKCNQLMRLSFISTLHLL